MTRPHLPQPIEQIRVHELLAKAELKLVHIQDITYHALSQRADLKHKLEDYMLQYVDGELSEDAVRLILLMHPVHVAKSNNNKWECIGGLRSLQIAKLAFNSATEILVTTHSRLGDNEREWICYADLLLSPLCLSARETVSMTLQTLSAEPCSEKWGKSWLPHIAASHSGMAHALNVSRSCIYRSRPKIATEIEQSLTIPDELYPTVTDEE
jgi:hypothetical protein